MGWPSTFEHIQDRRDEAGHFRLAETITGSSIAPEATLPEIQAVEIAPQPPDDPVKRHRLHNWMRRLRLARGGYEWTHDTVIWRGHKQRYTEKIKDVSILTFDRSGTRRAVRVDFKISSKGGGETHLSARFGPQDFQTLIQAMLVADRQAALTAMTEELAHHRN